VTPLYPQKLALTSPTGGGRSVGIVRSRAKATELVTVFGADGHGNTIGQKKVLTYFRGPGQFSRSVLRLPFSGYVHLTLLSVLTAL